MLKEGSKAPAFKLPSHQGGTVALRDLKGRWVVIYFYPRDNTPGCTTEAQDFRDAAKELDELGAVVLGVSKDSLKSHEGFAAKHELPFALLSDPDGTTIDQYGAWGEKKLYGKTSMGIVRTTVLIDPEGRVLKVFAKVRVNGHVAAVLDALRAAQA